MSDMEKIKSNFVRGLEENNNRILTYVTIFFTFAFLGCLLAFWVYEYRSNRCVFGPSCCYTDMSNSSKTSSVNEAILKQVEAPPGKKRSWNVSSGNYERVTFGYPEQPASTTGDKLSSFTLDIYNAQKIATGISFPNIPESNSGFSFISEKGVSVYLDYYLTDNRWVNSNQLVSHGVCEYLKDLENYQQFYAIVTPNSSGFNYISSQDTYGGKPVSITTTLNSGGYFKGLTSITSKKIISVDTDNYNYNPFMDFLHSKRKVKDSNKCTSGVSCHCIEPSSKNLPSCKNPYFEGRGYAYLTRANSDTVSYSTNCSHSYYPGYIVDPSKQNTAANQGYIEEAAPPESGLGKTLTTNCGNTSLDGEDCGPPGSGNKTSVNLKLGKTPFEKGDGNNFTSSYQNSYAPTNIFCGGGNQSNPKVPLYASIQPNGPAIGTATRGSSFPNAQIKGSGRVLGFS